VDTDSRRVFRSEISQCILAGFAAAGIVIASQTVAVVQFPSTGPQGQPARVGGQLEEEQAS
jgi:hypothetical protein